jgi:hypothetical protein
MANRIKESNITPGAVTSDKIAPGTVSASNISPGSITTTQIAPGTIASSNIAPGTIANDRLANNSVTINGSSVSLGGSVDISAGTDWQTVVTADGSTATTASAGEGYFIDTTSAAHTVTLPSSPTQGDEVHIVDYAGTFGSNNVTVGRNGSNIDGSAVDSTLATNRLNVRFVYIDATQGWRAVFDDASENYGQSYISATGGTVTESGDFKIHTFTGDGCFVVSCGGNVAGSNSVDYIVVGGGAGGGSGDGGGGGGAGGFRESHSVPVSGCYTASPLATPTAIPVITTSYPITVGAGGAAGLTGQPDALKKGQSGSPSIFSTITSAGGGGGGAGPSANPTPIVTGTSGGSGGGGSSNPCGQPGGNGNTPPVSPPQGRNGGAGTANPAAWRVGGGGGGATCNGAGGNPCSGGAGGSGATTSISTSPTIYAGGGGGAGHPSVNPGYGGAGGPGGGGKGAGKDSPGTGGSANTGGGGGSGWAGDGNGAAGGKGIVIIRYKFQ